MIKKEIVNDNNEHILIRCNEPCRFEIIKSGNGFVIHGYKGTRINMNQDPCLFHDSQDKF